MTVTMAAAKWKRQSNKRAWTAARQKRRRGGSENEAMGQQDYSDGGHANVAWNQRERRYEINGGGSGNIAAMAAEISRTR